TPSRGRTRGAGIDALLADLELFRWHSEVDLDAPIDNAHGVGVHWEYRRKRSNFARQQVETSAVSGALDEAIFELTFAQDAAVVGADIVDRAPGVVFAV